METRVRILALLPLSDFLSSTLKQPPTSWCCEGSTARSRARHKSALRNRPSLPPGEERGRPHYQPRDSSGRPGRGPNPFTGHPSGQVTLSPIGIASLYPWEMLTLETITAL